MLNRKYKWLHTGLLVIALATFSLGFVSYKSDNIYEINKNLDIFGQLFRVVNNLYVDETDPEKLIRTGIDAMLNSLDPYTSFISEEEAEKVSFMSTGKYAGIGALVGKRGGRILIIEPYQGAPADMAGIRAGDQIINIDGKSIAGLDISNIRNILRGSSGTMVNITVLRGDTEHKIQVIRDEVQIENVPYFGMANNEVGYIQLTGFTENAGRDVRNALGMLSQQSNLKGVILDLRNNPGGRLDEAVNVANVFLPQREVIVETRGRHEGTRTLHISRRSPMNTEIPLAVLIDEGSASASEIVAGAIQDLDRGVIIGNKSFGKGLVQNIQPLSYNTQLKITTAKYYTPSGRCIQSLDYRNRNENGSASRIPDSLQNTFSTRNGREVSDGGGIHPDIPVSDPEAHPMIAALINQGHLFDFATYYVAQHDSIAAPRNFHLNDEIFSMFKTFIAQQSVDYQTPADQQLSQLKKLLQEEDYYESVEKEIQQLEALITQHKNEELDRLRQELSPLLEAEIAKRYYYNKGMVEVLFDDDRDILKAIEILKDQALYQSILSPNDQKSGK